MKKFKVNADMGSVKVFDKNFSAFFSNGYGDGEATVYISEKEPDRKEFTQYVELLEIKTKAYLAAYDCNDESIHTFVKGRYHVYNDRKGNVFFYHFSSTI